MDKCNLNVKMSSYDNLMWYFFEVFSFLSLHEAQRKHNNKDIVNNSIHHVPQTTIQYQGFILFYFGIKFFFA